MTDYRFQLLPTGRCPTGVAVMSWEQEIGRLSPGRPQGIGMLNMEF